jgi:hypothetical protein
MRFRNLLLFLAAAGVLFLIYSWERARYSEQRAYDVACREAGKLLREAEKHGGEVPENISNVKKMLQSPRVKFSGLPFELTGHLAGGFHTYEIDGLPRFVDFNEVTGDVEHLKNPPEELLRREREIARVLKGNLGDGENTRVLLDGVEVGLEDVPTDIRTRISHAVKEAEGKLKNIRAAPKTSRRGYLLDSMREAWQANKVLVIKSIGDESVYEELKGAVRQAEGEQMPGLIIIVVSESPKLAQLRGIMAGTGVAMRAASYKLSLDDLFLRH